jgi:hypothetical protein
MVRTIFLFPSSMGDDAVDGIVDKHLAPGAKVSNASAMTMSQGPLMGAGGPSPYRRVVEITHESIEDMMKAARSGEQGKETAMKEAGIQIIAFEMRDV